MSFNFGFSRTTFLLVAAACGLWANSSLAGGSMEVCARYADDAFYTMDDMKRAGCSVDRSGGPGTLSINYNYHFRWCRNESTAETRASEKKARDKAKNKCLPTLVEMVCADFATKGVEASRQWQVFRCTDEHHPTGRFSYKYNDHYNSCMKTGGLNAEDEDKARNDELEACKQADSDSRHKKVTSLGVKRTTTKQESADDEDATEERLAISDAIDTVADERYTPVSKLKVKRTVEDVTDTVAEAPVRAATEMIVVGNRYVEVPAYSSNNDDDGRIGDVVKAGAAAAVVGTAAVGTAVVAGKAIDYVDEHRDEIKDGVGSLKDKLKDRLGGREVTVLKDKIKDKLEGGGGFDRIKDGVGSLKEKLKDRVGGREVTVLKDKLKDRAGGLGKVASGMKEKLKDGFSRSGSIRNAASGFKDKLKDKVSGGGGVIKGMAKAGGGLLRRLAGR